MISCSFSVGLNLWGTAKHSLSTHTITSFRNGKWCLVHQVNTQGKWGFKGKENHFEHIFYYCDHDQRQRKARKQLCMKKTTKQTVMISSSFTECEWKVRVSTLILMITVLSKYPKMWPCNAKNMHTLCSYIVNEDILNPQVKNDRKQTVLSNLYHQTRDQ